MTARIMGLEKLVVAPGTRDGETVVMLPVLAVVRNGVLVLEVQRGYEFSNLSESVDGLQCLSR